MAASDPLRTLEARKRLPRRDNRENIVVKALSNFTCVELIANMARQEASAGEPM